MLLTDHAISPYLSIDYWLALGLHYSLAVRRIVMQLVITALAVLAGLFFSFAISLLVEELIFGKIFGFFFAHPAPVPAKSTAKR
jgi:hypothetical protein